MRRPLGTFLFLVLLAAPASSQVVELEAVDGIVRARKGERIVWENVHARRGQSFRSSTNPGGLTQPVSIGDAVYYAVGLSLYAVDADSGAVRRRIKLPGPCASLAAEGGELVVVLESAYESPGWSRSYRLTPEKPDLPFFLGGWLLAARLPRDDAEAVLADVLRADPDAPKGSPEDPSWRQSAEALPYVERAVVELSELARRDQTNPWYRYHRGVLLQDLGRDGEARDVFASTLELSRDYDAELLPLALRLDRVAPELGDEAFRRAMSFLMTHGYEPEMSQWLIVLLLHYGKPERMLDSAKDLERINKLAERIWDLAPYAEGTASFYGGVADANLEADREVARLWESRSLDALPQRNGVPRSSFGEQFGVALNIAGAALLTWILVVFVKGLRYFPTQRRARGRFRWNGFFFWTRAELVGFLVVLALGLAAWWMAARTLVAVGRAANFPSAAAAGNYGHPAGVDYLKGFGGSAGGDFIYALALQKAGALQEAAEMYTRLEGTRARNNLGVIRHAQGREADARKLFAEALAADPGLAEAAYNLGEEVRSPRVERAQKYGLTGPLYAMPSGAMWDEALTSSWSFAESQIVFERIFERSFPERVMGSPPTVVVLLILFATALAVLGLFLRPSTAPSSTTVSKIGWGLGLLVPGTARQLGFLGPPLLSLFCFSAIVAYYLAHSQGVATNLLDMVQINASGGYGLYSPSVYSALQVTVRRTADLWWIVWMVNLGAVLFLERLRPDPCGPQGPRVIAEKPSE